MSCLLHTVLEFKLIFLIVPALFKSCGKFKKHMTTVNFAFTLFTTEVTLKIAQNKYAIF